MLAAAGSLSALALALALPAVGVPATAATPPASPGVPTTPGDTGTTPALVELTGLGPLDPAAGDTVTLEGTITNRSDQPLTALNAYLRLSRIPVLDRTDLVRLDEPGFRPGARQPAFVLASDALAPGASAPFRLEIASADLGLTEPGVYAAGIEVLASSVDGRGTVGRAMTALPWMPAAEAIQAVGVAVAWPVTAPVDRAADGSYLSAELGQAFGPGGRLAAILATPTDAEVTWLVDPAVVEAAADLADGYDVREEPGDPASTRPGTAAEDASDWLEQVSRLADAGRVTLMPYADVDAVALGRAGLGDDAVIALDAAEQAAEALGLDQADGARDLLRPPGGRVDPPTAERLAAGGVTRFLLDASNVVTAATAPTTVRLELGAGTVVAVLADDALRGLFSADPSESATSPAATELAARQLLLAHTALAAIAAPTDAAYIGPTVLVVSGDEASTVSPGAVLAGLDQDVPWLRQTTLEAAEASPTVDGALRYPDDAVAAELPGAYVAGIGALQEKARLRAALAPADDPAAPDPPALDAATATRLRAAAAAWRAEPARAAAAVAEEVRAIEAELGEVRILDGGSITLSSQTGRFPLTVVNDLTVPVTVQITLASRTPARLRVPDVTAIEVPAGARTTVDVSAQANADGEYVVDAGLATSTGERFGSASSLTIRATDYDTVAWVVMGAAGGLLLIGSARRINRRVRAARSTSAPPGVES